jgi:hypothetical protein
MPHRSRSETVRTRSSEVTETIARQRSEDVEADKNKRVSDDWDRFSRMLLGFAIITHGGCGRPRLAGTFATCMRATHDGEANGSSEKD